MKISNRIIMPALHLNLAQDGYITNKIIDFYVERAKGGAGLILIGGVYIDKYAQGAPMMISIENDNFIPKLTEFTNAIHEARDDVKVGAQLYHGGRYSLPLIIGTTPISSSSNYCRLSRTTSREMTLEEIKKEQQAFTDATLRAQKAGFDCIEICGSAGYLIDQFLSPLVNKRTDKYGGNLENRLRFALETIESIKSAVEDNFIVGMRMAGDDFVQGSLTYKDKPEIAKAYEKQGIDFINVTGGWHETRIPQLTMDVPEGCYVYLADNIKKKVSIPVFASNRMNDPIIAEEVLMSEKADAVCIGRGLIADPYWPTKVKNGNLNDIMYCVACNQGCFDNIFSARSLKCLRNARAGNEAKTELKPIENKKKVMIIGAGPAGLEAARVARKRGYEVHVFEKTDRIGGLLNIIWVPPGRGEFRRIENNYKYWIIKLGIKVNFNTEVTVEKIKEFNPDVVILATGTIPIKPKIKGIDKPHVYHANDALARDTPIGENNVIIGGGATGIELAIYIAKFGRLSLETFEFLTFYKALEVDNALKMMYKGKKQVTILESLPKCGSNIGITTKWVLLEKAKKLGVNILTSVDVTEIGENYVNYTNSSGVDQMIQNVDAVYYATGVISNDMLYRQIKSLNIPVYKIGDAKKPATILEAIQSAYKIGNNI